MRRLVAAAVAVSVFALAGCGSAANDTRTFERSDGGNYWTGWLKVNGNREVFCLFWNTSLSCDWSKQR
ncbi:Uncharacterised protein [Mycobacteroides abscessus subsp. abscessus]|nr:Uncharacterised protein [Mycobacteroides abscessus subsp. abscessus]